MELYRNIIDCNDINGAPLFNENIRYEIHRVILEEEVEANNVNADNFCQMSVTPNTQGENENTIMISERLNNSDALAETLKGLTINDTGYYE